MSTFLYGLSPADSKTLEAFRAGLTSTSPQQFIWFAQLHLRNPALYSLGRNFKDDASRVVRDDEGKVEIWVDGGNCFFRPVPK